MGVKDSIARRFGYLPENIIETRVNDIVDVKIEEAIKKRPTQVGTSYVVNDPVRTGELNFAPPIVTGLGRNKAVLTEWWINPLYGQPRLVDLRTVKQLARHGIATMCIEKIIDIITQQGWAIMPKKGKKMNQAHHDRIVEFLHHPNRNNETFESILRKIIRGILETDDGTIVKVYDQYEERDVYSFVDSGRNQPALPTQNANTSNPLGSDKFPTKNAELIEIFAEDGSSFLKGVDMHGYLYRYFQYSFIIPRKPIMFDPKEISYISANSRSGCLIPKTIITTNPSYKFAGDIKVGDKVLSKSGYGRVEKLFKRPYKGKLVCVTPYGLEAIKATPEHPFLTKDGWKDASKLNHCDVLIYSYDKEVVDIEKIQLLDDQQIKRNKIYRICQTIDKKDKNTHKSGRLSCVAQKYNVPSFWINNYANSGDKPKYLHLNECVTVDENLLWIVGLFLGDGYVAKKTRGGKTIGFSLGLDKDNITDKLSNAIRMCFGDVNVRVRNRHNNKEVILDSKPIGTFFEQFYRIEHDGTTKHIPNWIMKLPVEKQKYLIQGLYISDGCLGNDSYRICNSSYELITQLRTIINRCGIWANIHNYKPKTGYSFKNNKGYWDLYITGSWRKDFLPIVNERCDIEETKTRNRKSYVCATDGGFFVPIRKLESEDYNGDVVNFTVEPENNFAVNGIITHNSPYGYAPMESITEWLTFLIQAGKYSQRFFQNSSYPAFQLDLPNVKTQAEMEAWAEWMRKNYMGEEKAFQALITNQNAKVVPLMFDHRALQNLESQQWYFSLVCAKLKVPQSLLGFTQSINRSTAGQQSATFISQGVKPLEHIIERQFNKDVIEELDPDGCCEWVFIEESDLNEEVTRSNIRATYIQNSIKTPNEVRTELNLDPIEGGDETMAQRNERTAKEGEQRQHEQNMQMESTKKPAPSKSPAFQGSEPKTGKELSNEIVSKQIEISSSVVKTPRKYLGTCSECLEGVYDDTKDLHKGHNLMSNGTLTKNR